jgi:hypothetical protein
MKLITDDQQAQLRANGLAAREAFGRGIDIDQMPVVKLYTPDAHAIWLLAYLNPHGGDRAYGLYDIGDGHPDLGYLYLFELEQPQTALNVVCDLDFVATKPLSAYAKEAWAHRHIIS